jgi:hypothetical protein
MWLRLNYCTQCTEVCVEHRVVIRLILFVPLTYVPDSDSYRIKSNLFLTVRTELCNIILAGNFNTLCTDFLICSCELQQLHG